MVAVLILTTVQPAAQAASLDLDRYCRENGHSHSTLTQYNAYGWVCVGYNGVYYGMDLNNACQTQYGSGWWAQYRNFNDPYSWECKRWCSVEPNAALFGWQGVNPNFALRIDGPESLDWDPGRGELYYVYYNGSYVGAGSVDPHGYFAAGYQEWGIDSGWSLSHLRWRDDYRWRIDYTLSDNTCPYRKHN